MKVISTVPVVLFFKTTDPYTVYLFFVTCIPISVTQKQECFSLLIFEAKNGIRQEK